jgi:hypothetical protein
VKASIVDELDAAFFDEGGTGRSDAEDRVLAIIERERVNAVASDRKGRANPPAFGTEAHKRFIAAQRKALVLAGGRHPARNWRVKSDDVGEFDELVVAHWLHLERMNKRTWCMQLGDRVFDITIAKDGKVTATERPAGS